MRRFLSVLVSLPLAALAAPSNLDAFRTAQEERAHGEVAELLRTLCPDQCVLLSVSARVDEERPPNVELGFTTPQEGLVPVVRGFGVEVAVDAALPKPFREKVEALVKQRLKGLGAPVRVGVETVAFPPPRAASTVPPAQVAPPAQPPPVINVQPPAAPTAAPAPLPRSASDAMAEAAPWLVLGALFAFTFLAAVALIALALRNKTQTEVVTEQPEPVVAVAPAPQPSSTRTLRKLTALEAISRDRAAAARVVHEALEQGGVREVAIWLRELGSPLLEVVRPDAARHAGLLQELTQPLPEDQEVVDALTNFEGRITGAVLGSGARGPLAAFEFLEGHAPADVAAALHSLDRADREIAVRFAPDAIRSTALPLLPADERRALALAFARPRSLTPQAVSVAAERTRAALAGHLGQATARDALSELLSTFEGAEQRALYDAVSAAGAVEGPIVEDALASIPAEALERVVVALPPRTLVTYLSGAGEAPRSAVLAACPRTLRRELEPELTHAGAVEIAEFRAARRMLLRMVDEELARDGARPSNHVKTAEAS